MNSLTAAHRGYEYQDLVIACRLVDVLLGTVVEVRVDQKLVDGDVFDDLTTMGADGSRERIQIKHTDRDDRPLAAARFTNDTGDLRLDKVFAAMFADRDGPGASAVQQTFRVVLRDTIPTDSRLTAVLRPAVRDPGPFLPTLQTVRLAFDPDALWAQMEQSSVEGSDSGDRPLAFLRDVASPLSYADLVWACGHLVIEVEAPAASRDLTTPELAEDLLLTRVRGDVGAGSFPNQDRDPVDVAAAMIGTARYARQGSHVVTCEEIIRRAQLRTDFGAVARRHPVDLSVQVPRVTAAQQIASKASELAEAGGTLLAVGPPGQGKSWLCKQVLEQLSEQGWLVAEHYCYLGDADSERSERVLAEAVFGSLVGRLADADPRVVEGQRPLLAADEETLVRCVSQSIEREPQRRVALVIDGIDHITRVRASSAGAFDPSTSLAEALAALEVPSGSVFIVLSQPGAHLRPLEDAGAVTVQVKGLNEIEIRSLATKLGLIPAVEATAHMTESALINDEGEIAAFLDALADRSAGNALYATYLCREASRHEATLASPASTVRDLPAFDGTLKNYYRRLCSTLGEGGSVADVISLLPFAVTRSELRSILPIARHHVDNALQVLAPVLVERAAQGGVRIYHESFARFLRRPFQDDHDALNEIIGSITAWLEARGIFEDSRAFRSLLPLLAEAGRDAEAIAIVGRDFVIRSVASGFPASAIVANLATATRSAARLGNWPLVTRYVELSRAAESYQTERLNSSLVEFADVPIALLGSSVVAERLLDDGRMVMAARDGLHMCAAVDQCGAVAPWQQYMAGYLRESKSDNAVYGDESDRAVSLALLRGRLRLAVTTGVGKVAMPDDRHDWRGVEPDGARKNREHSDSAQQIDLDALIDWSRVANWVQRDQLDARDVVEVIADTCGVDGVSHLIPHLEQPGAMCLALSEHLAHGREDPDAASAREWVSEAAAHGIPPGALHAALSIDTGVLDEIESSIADSRGGLLELTRRVQEPSIQWESDDLDTWLDACTLAAHRDPLGLNAAEALIAGEGWYKCWLHFTTALARADTAHPRDKAAHALDAIRCLEADLNPFSGNPRACDLLLIQPLIAETIRRALALVDDEKWAESIRLLHDVSLSITTTLHGSIGGPMPPDLVVRIAVDGTNRARRDVAAELLERQIEDGSAGRFYTYLAEFQLLGARLALNSDDPDKALRHWHRACQMLTSYGQRKDITIFELLDPLPELIAADRHRGQERVARVQCLCERIPRHTDLKATRWAWGRWWSLLALADPVALARLAAPRLLQRCNQPNGLLHDALEDLWSSWCERADPLLAGALRLTLDTPLDAKDADALRLLTTRRESESTDADDLATWLLARADERPISYGDTNSDDRLARDDQKVAALNSVARAADLPRISELRQCVDTPAEQPPSTSGQTGSTIRSAQRQRDEFPNLPPGPAGLANAIRSWRRRPYETSDPSWAVDRFANILGYRLLELADDGREQDAASALHSLAEACEFGPRTELLQAVAEGLDRQGRARLATIASTLVWTRTRGHGSVNFAGKTELKSLHRATELDAALVLRVVAEEVERSIVSRRSGTYGISQALIQAFCAGAFAVPNKQSLDVAFAAWDEAFAVIADRAPWVHASEDPEDPYIPTDLGDSTISQSDLDSAFALGALASLAHPGREKKRRSLLAAQLLLSERPTATTAAFDFALSALSEPATIVWLLRLVELSGSDNPPIIAACKQTLIRLATGQHLVVRTLARRLLGSDAPPLPPPSPADEALISNSDARFWTPTGDEEPESDEPPGTDELVSATAGQRLSRAEGMLPGLSEAVRSLVRSAARTEHFQERLTSQLDAYADRVDERFPDAYLFGEQTTEDALQLAAAGGRAARITAGEATSDPVAWENDLADALLDEPTLPLALEATRIPRPPIPAPPSFQSEIWVQVIAEAPATSERGPVESSLEPDGVLSVTLQVEPGTAAWTVERARFRGWRMIAAVEEQVFQHPDWRDHSEFVAERYRVVELRHPEDEETLDMPPVTLGDIRVWETEVEQSDGIPLPDRTVPLFGLDFAIAGVGDGRAGLGVQSPLLAPTPRLISDLRLHPGEPFTLHDSQGCGLVLATWRAAYDTSEYYVPRPQLVGSAVLARPDLLERLLARAGHRLILRDFAVLTRQLRQSRSSDS